MKAYKQRQQIYTRWFVLPVAQVSNASLNQIHAQGWKVVSELRKISGLPRDKKRKRGA